MPADDGCGALQARKRDVVFGAEKPVNLSAASLEPLGHPVLRDFLFLHRLCELPGNDLLDGGGPCFIEDAFLFDCTFREILTSGGHVEQAVGRGD